MGLADRRDAALFGFIDTQNGDHSMTTKAVPHKAADAVAEFMDDDEVCRAIKRGKKTLQRWHARGEGPPRTKVGAQNLYNIAQFKDWLRDRAGVSGDTT